MTNAELQAFARQFSGTSGQFNEDLSAALTVCGVPEGRQIIERLNALFRVSGANSWQLALTYGLPSLWLDFTLGGALDPRITFFRASAATRVNASGLIESISSGQPRFDYDPVTHVCKGLLIEEQRTNLLTYSEQFDNAGWVKLNASISANATTAPDGTLTADKFVENTLNAEHYLDPSVSVTSGVTYTYSVVAKAADQSILQMRTVVNFPDASSRFDLSAGTVSSNGHGAGNAGIVSLGNGWYRCYVTATANGTGPGVTRLQLWRLGTPIYQGDGTSGIYIWGAQLEAGAFPTSYIPTTSAQVTRAADLMSMTGKNFSDWYMKDEGTFVCEAVLDDTNRSSTPVLMGVCSDGYSNSMYLSMLSGTSMVNTSIVANNIDYTSGTLSSTINKGKPFCVAMSYKKNNVAYCMDGATVLIDSTAEIPNATQMGIGKAPWGNSSYLNGHISRLTYYPRRLSNAQLQAFTS